MASTIERREEGAYRAATGNLQLRIELGERLEREPPLVQPRMGNAEARLLDDEVAVDEEVEVECPRPPALAVPHAPELALDGEQLAEKLLRRQGRLDRDGAVQEAWLVDDADRVGLDELRDTHDLHPVDPAEPLDRPAKGRLTIPEVRAQPDVRPRHLSLALDDHRGELHRRVEHDVRLPHADADALDRREAFDDPVRDRPGETLEQ